MRLTTAPASAGWLADRGCRLVRHRPVPATHARSGSWIVPRIALASSVRAIRRFTVRPVLPEPWPPWATWPATCAGPGTRRRRTSSRPSTPSCGSRAGTTRCACSAPWAGPGSRSWPRDERLPRAARRRPTPTSSATSPATAGTSARPAPRRPRAIALLLPGVRHHLGAAAVLRRPRHPRRRPPQGGQRPRRPADRRRACSTATATSGRRSSREGWQQETYPVLDPDGLPISLLREADGSRALDLDRHARRARPGGPDLGRPASAGCRCCCSTPTSRATPSTARRDRPPLRRQQRAPAAPGAAARRRRRPRAARVLADHRRTRRPRCSTPTRATPASSASSGSASSPSPRRARARLRHRARGRPRRHRVHHAHPGAGRHRPVPARRWSSSTSATTGADRPASRSTGSWRSAPRTTTGGDAGGLQHGGDGLPPRPARQRRLAAARRGQPRHVQRPVAGLRRGRGADRLDHQRRARPDLGGPRGLRARRPATAPTPTATTPTASGPPSTRCPAADIWATKRAAARAARRRRPQAAAQVVASSAARPRPSSAGSTPRSTPTC